MPALVLQMILCKCIVHYFMFNVLKFLLYYTGIGTNDNLIPNDFELDYPLGNVNACIIRCGFLLLDSYLNLSRSSLDEDKIIQCSESLELAIAMQYQMTCIKQALGVVANAEDTEMKDTKEMKPHMVQHIPPLIPLFGTPKGFNTIRT